MRRPLDCCTLAAFTTIALAAACVPPPEPARGAAEEQSTAPPVAAAPVTNGGGEEAPKPVAAKPPLPDGPLQKPASKLTFGGASLSTIDAKQAVAAFKKAGFRAEPTAATANPTTLTSSAFGNVTGHWDTLEFELSALGSKSVSGNAEIVRPAKKVRPVPPAAEAERSAEGTVTRYEKMTQGLLSGGGIYDPESETSFSVMITADGKDKSAIALVRRLTAKAQ